MVYDSRGDAETQRQGSGFARTEAQSHRGFVPALQAVRPAETYAASLMRLGRQELTPLCLCASVSVQDLRVSASPRETILLHVEGAS